VNISLQTCCETIPAVKFIGRSVECEEQCISETHPDGNLWCCRRQCSILELGYFINLTAVDEGKIMQHMKERTKNSAEWTKVIEESVKNCYVRAQRWMQHPVAIKMKTNCPQYEIIAAVEKEINSYLLRNCPKKNPSIQCAGYFNYSMNCFLFPIGHYY
jgi:hypothetical protein